MERAGKALLGLLELGVASAASYPTPLGPRPRTPEAVREALAELRDPQRRLLHELWALPPEAATDDAAERAGAGGLLRFQGARRALGWGP